MPALKSFTRADTKLVNLHHNRVYYTFRSQKDLERLEEKLRSGKATKADKKFAAKMRSMLCGSSECDCTLDWFGRKDW